MAESRAEPVQLGRYTLLGRLAGGGMGTVHLARARGERGFSRPVAVKLLHAHLAEDANIVTRFLEEARVAALVKHPHVVSVLDVGETAGAPFLVLDYVHGESFEGLLRAARKAGEPVPLDVIAAIATDLLEGLAAAHSAKDALGAPLDVVHRDVSPHNVLVSGDGIAYVTDFGIAKVRDRLRITGTNDMLGKAGYMAPEQLGGPGGITPQTDLYSAGIVVWEALTGRKLFDGLEEQMLALVQGSEAPLASHHRPDVPPALDALVASMLARDPAARPASAMACHGALVEALPRAAPANVARWMRGYASERLARVEALLAAPTPEAAPAAPVDASTIPADAATAIKETPRRRRPLAALLLGAIVTFAIGLGVMRARTPERAPVAEVNVASPVAAPTSPPTSDPAPAAPTDAPVATTTSSARSLARGGPHARAAASAGNGSCNPPYVVVDTIKHYKRECFAGAGQ